jgi:hypothetical protein
MYNTTSLLSHRLDRGGGVIDGGGESADHV